MPSASNLTIARRFNQAAERYNQYAMVQGRATQLLYDSISPLLTPHASILDLGCGTGYLGTLLARSPFPYHLYQLDLAFNMCQKASQYYLPHHFSIQSDINALPFAYNSFSLVVSSMTLQWLDNLTPVFEQVNRILKPGGKFACTLVGDGSLAELINSFQGIGLHAPVNTFPTQQDILHAIPRIQIPSAQVTLHPIVNHYHDLLSLLKHFKGLGANTLKKQEQRSVLSKARLRHIDSYYKEHYAGLDQQLPVTWNIYKVQWVK
jgi:malonyl-CoA O-methyltransferase